MASLGLAENLNIPQLPSYLGMVNKRLVKAADSTSPALKQPLLRAVNAKSKRLRPALVLACGLGAELSDSTVSGGAAIELVHLGSLVHDDIIDKSDSRWGRPTINVSDGDAAALLVGDFLLARAGGLAAKLSTEAAQLISQTITTLAEGESLEITEKYKTSRTIDSYFACINAKTAALISAACRLGATCAGLNSKQTHALAEYGQNLGIAFQIIDDLMDILSTPQLLGKPVGRDAKSGVYTLPVLVCLQGLSQKSLKTLLAKSNFSNQALAKLLLNDGSITQVITEIKKYNHLAQRALAGLNAQAVSGLSAFPDIYLGWALMNQIAPAYRSKISSHQYYG